MGGERASGDTVWRAGDDGGAYHSEFTQVKLLLQGGSETSINILFFSLVLFGVTVRLAKSL